MIEIIPFIYEDTDDLFSNTYLLVDENNDAVVIDPGKDYPGLTDYINKNQLKLKAILLSHGHADHMRGVNRLMNNFDTRLYIGFDDEDKLKDSYANCSFFVGEEVIINHKAETLSDKQVLHLLSEDIIAIHVPFHTSGSMCFYLKDSNALFTGDFILPHSVGRSDLPSAMPRQLNNSMAKIKALPKSVKIYPGHGPFSTLEIESKVNPFVK